MVVINIVNGDNQRLRRILGDELSSKIELKRGHTVVEVDPIDVEQTAVGRAAFERLIQGGYVAFSVREGPEPPVKINEWNPDEHPEVVMFAPLAGG